MPVKIFQPSLRRGSIRLKKAILYVFHRKFSVFLRSHPAHHPVLFCQCVQAQIMLDAQLGSGQPVPESIILFTPHFSDNITLIISHNHSLGHFCSSVIPLPRKTANISPCRLLPGSSICNFWLWINTSRLFCCPFALYARNSAHFGPVRTASTSSSVTITPAPSP